MRALHILLFTSLGVAAGIAHAVTLVRTLGAAQRSFDLLLVRLLVVGGALTAAAMFGQLWSACLAWLAAFCGTLLTLDAAKRARP